MAVQFLWMHIACPPPDQVTSSWVTSLPLHPSVISTCCLFQLNKSCTTMRSQQGSCCSEILKASAHEWIFIRWLLQGGSFYVIITAFQLQWNKYNLDLNSLKKISAGIINTPPSPVDDAFWLWNKIHSLRTIALSFELDFQSCQGTCVFLKWQKVKKTFDWT